MHVGDCGESDVVEPCYSGDKCDGKDGNAEENAFASHFVVCERDGMGVR